MFDLKDEQEVMRCQLDGKVIALNFNKNTNTSEETLYLYTNLAFLYCISLNKFSMKMLENYYGTKHILAR